MSTTKKSQVKGESTDREQRANSAPSHTMSPGAQRIAIARACGWGISNGNLSKDGFPFVYVGTRVTRWSQLDRHDLTAIPDYLSDLNAMHEAEEILTVQQCMTYRDWLGQNIQPSAYSVESRRYIWHATASQRAEAFLRTIGKWTESARGSEVRAGETNTDTP